QGAVARFSSAMLFHSPQPGQRPCHFGLSWPQELQAKIVADFGIPARLSPRVDGFAPAPAHSPHRSVRPARFDGRSVLNLDAPVASAEFIALDTETNGYGGDLCEMTEVGAGLGGGGGGRQHYA